MTDQSNLDFFGPGPSLPDQLRNRACPAGELWTGDDPAADHGHTDCRLFHEAAGRIEALESQLAARPSIPPAHDLHATLSPGTLDLVRRSLASDEQTIEGRPPRAGGSHEAEDVLEVEDVIAAWLLDRYQIIESVQGCRTLPTVLMAAGFTIGNTNPPPPAQDVIARWSSLTSTEAFDMLSDYAIASEILSALHSAGLSLVSRDVPEPAGEPDDPKQCPQCRSRRHDQLGISFEFGRVWLCGHPWHDQAEET